MIRQLGLNKTGKIEEWPGMAGKRPNPRETKGLEEI
jgi:hypothetical protein